MKHSWLDEAEMLKRQIVDELNQINERGMPAMHQRRLADAIEELVGFKINHYDTWTDRRK